MIWKDLNMITFVEFRWDDERNMMKTWWNPWLFTPSTSRTFGRPSKSSPQEGLLCTYQSLSKISIKISVSLWISSMIMMCMMTHDQSQMCRLFHCGVPHETLGTLPKIFLFRGVSTVATGLQSPWKIAEVCDVYGSSAVDWFFKPWSQYPVVPIFVADISFFKWSWLSIWEPLRPLNVCDLLVPASDWPDKLREKLEESVSQLQRTGYLVSNHGISGCFNIGQRSGKTYGTYGTYVSKFWKFEDPGRTQGGMREDPGVNSKTWCWGDYSCLCRIRRWELNGAVVADLNRSHDSRFADSLCRWDNGILNSYASYGLGAQLPCFQSQNYTEIPSRNMMYQSKTSQHLRFLWNSTLNARFSIEIYDIHGIHGNLLPFDHRLVTEVVRLFKIGRYSEGQKTQKFLPFFPLNAEHRRTSLADLPHFLRRSGDERGTV